MKVTVKDYFGDITYTDICRIIKHDSEYILVMFNCKAEAGIHVGINDLVKIEE